MKRRRNFFLLGLLFFLGLCWQFPLFHVVPLKQLNSTNEVTSFDAAEFADDLWSTKLVPSFEHAADAGELCALLGSDPQSALKNFGHKVGIGRVVSFYLQGEGTIIAVEKSGVSLSVTAPDDRADVKLKSGLLFGNTVRDATRLLNASEFANSQHFNSISTELNRIVEKKVQPALRAHSAVGRKIRFVGCADVRATSKSFLPLTVIPLQVSFPKSASRN